VGQASGAPALTFANGGEAPLPVTGVSLGGVAPGEYRIDSDGCTGKVLSLNASCSVTASFRPTSAGERTARLQVSHPDTSAGAVATATLTGSATVPPVAPAPVMSLAPSQTVVAQPRLVPRSGARIRARTTRSRRGRTLTLRTTGAVTPPAGLDARTACAAGGRVRVQVKRGTRAVSTRLVRLRRDCTFRSSVAFRGRSRIGRRTRALRVRATFTGNDARMRAAGRFASVRI
jgi:hypothetical protein